MRLSKSGFADCPLVRESVDETVTISGRLRLSDKRNTRLCCAHYILDCGLNGR